MRGDTQSLENRIVCTENLLAKSLCLSECPFPDSTENINSHSDVCLTVHHWYK